MIYRDEDQGSLCPDPVFLLHLLALTALKLINKKHKVPLLILGFSDLIFLSFPGFIFSDALLYQSSTPCLDCHINQAKSNCIHIKDGQNLKVTSIPAMYCALDTFPLFRCPCICLFMIERFYSQSESIMQCDNHSSRN